MENMNQKEIIISIILFAWYIFTCAWWVGRLRKRHKIQVAYTRKLFHFLIFTAAGVIQWYKGLDPVLLFGVMVSVAVMFAVWKGNGFAFYEALARESDKPYRSTFIIIPLVTTALGGLLSNLFFPVTVVAGYLASGWGDAIAEPVGNRFGKHRYKVSSLFGVAVTRSREGSLAVWIVSFIAVFLFMMSIQPSLGTGLLAALCCATAATLTEAFSTHGLDNLTVQLAVAGIASLFI